MSQDNKNETMIYRASRKSVYEAVDMLKSNVVLNKKRGRDEQQKEIKSKVTRNCTSICNPRKHRKLHTTGYSKSLFISKIRSCMARQDWRHLLHYFPLLLNYPKDMELLMWRYALSILLYSPYSSSSNFQQFLQLCLGCHVFNKKHLEKLLLLRSS